jgi:hypothetical protein
MHRFLIVLALSGCLIGDATSDGGDDGNGGPDDIGISPDAIDPANLTIGFNDGYVDELNFYPDYFAIDTTHEHLCHTYVNWNVMDQAPGAGDPTDSASRAYIDAWLTEAQHHCDEVLLSFKSHVHMTAAPAALTTYASAFDRFAANNWTTETGYTGSFAYTPWNEPNNAADAGDGLGIVIDPRLAARYYLVAEKSCRSHGCKVAAGDFASNGNMWDDFEWNCQNDAVATGDLCKQKSSANSGNKPASYLDKYKNEIVNEATSVGLPSGFRPAYFAYHGWHDANNYLNFSDHCTAYDNCALRKVLRSMSGSWAGAEIWDSEDGAGQQSAPNDGDQACTAAFMVRLQTISTRVRRMYVTRLHGGNGGLIHDDHSVRPALDVFAHRDRTRAGCS